MALLGSRVKQHSSHSNGGGEELWLVSYADMMTLLFGFFVILYSLSQVDDRKMSEVGKQIAEAFGGETKTADSTSEVGMMMESRHLRALQLLIAMLNLGETVEEAVQKIESVSADAKNLQAAKEMVQESMKAQENDPSVAALKMTALDKPDRIELALPDSMLFESGTATLTPRAREGLKQIASYLAKLDGLVGIEITGHTDSAPASKRSIYPSNWALSSARAGAVAELLIADGLDPKTLLTRGMADTQPLFSERKPDGTLIPENMVKNRRVNIVVKKANHGKE